jgi:uncharacterized protein YbjQ (UPF0145 family)
VRNAILAALGSTNALVQESLDGAKDVVQGQSTAYTTESEESLEERVERILTLIKNQDEY